MIKVNGQRVLFVDPGLLGTGWAFFPECWPTISSDRIQPEGYRPTAWGVISVQDPRADWVKRAHYIAKKFDDVLYEHNVRYVGMEFPGVWKHSLRSQVSSDSGDLHKLTYLIGLLGCKVYNYTQQEPVLFAPLEWKGQLPKDVVTRRVQKLCGTKFSNHVGDAVGMGYAAQGLLEQKGSKHGTT
jgi:hypothetical protein